MFGWTVGGHHGFSGRHRKSWILFSGHPIDPLALFTFGFAKAGLMPFIPGCPGPWSPTPVSALLRKGGGGQVGVFACTGSMRIFMERSLD